MDFNAAKGICLTVFFLITIVLGTLPLCLITKFKIQLQDGSRSKIVLSFLNCFAGGVFLGTCLLNMFTEGQEQFEEYKETVGFDNEYPFFQAGVGSTSACGQFVNENFSTAVELTRETETGIWSTFVGISIHKAIVALCLGLELTAAIPDKPLRVVLCLLFFALMAPMGVAIGMGVTSGGVNMGAQLLAASILQALATGSFLFVTFLEILGPELRGHDLGIYKVMVATFGFLITAGVKVLDAD
nr:hypothetical protein BaRGS_007798 [Batillaria attramentaria]